jgi:hypothetical protein
MHKHPPGRGLKNECTPWNTTNTERLRALASADLSQPEIANEMEHK